MKLNNGNVFSAYGTRAYMHVDVCVYSYMHPCREHHPSSNQNVIRGSFLGSSFLGNYKLNYSECDNVKSLYLRI